MIEEEPKEESTSEYTKEKRESELALLESIRIKDISFFPTNEKEGKRLNTNIHNALKTRYIGTLRELQGHIVPFELFPDTPLHDINKLGPKSVIQIYRTLSDMEVLKETQFIKDFEAYLYKNKILTES